MQMIFMFQSVIVLCLLLAGCGFEAGPTRIYEQCEGEFYIGTVMTSDGKCDPKLEIISSEGAVITRSYVRQRIDTIRPNDYEASIIGSLRDPCTDAIVNYWLICGKDTVVRTAAIKSLGFQATGPRKTSYNRLTGLFEYDIEFGCCPNAPAGQYDITPQGFGKIDFLKVVPDKITCPNAGGPQTIHVSGFAKDTLYNAVSVTLKGAKSECSIYTTVK